MKNLTIGKRIALGSAAIILVAAALSVFAYGQLRAIGGHSTRITAECLPGIYLVGQVESAANANGTLVLKDLLTHNDDLQAEFELNIQTNQQQIALLAGSYEKTITDPKERERFAAFEAARRTYSSALQDVLKLAHDGKSQAAMEAKQSRLDPAFDSFITSIHGQVAANKARGDTAGIQIQAAVASAQHGVLTGLALALLVAAGISRLTIRGIGRVLNQISSDLDDNAAQLSGSAGQITATSQSLAEGANEQAASLEETSSALEEMASMTKRNSEHARQANQLAKEARAAADKGVGDMQTMASAMEAIKVSSDDIAKIIKTIDEIAFQTNILALNAAVEAARAGESGMGFAVVADEVRNLAQRSAQAAKETAGKIEGAITKTGQGVGISSKVSQTLNDIVTKVRQVDELLSEVASASHEQTDGITQINTAVGQMDKVTQGNAAKAEESAAAAEELNAQSLVMKQSVNELLQLVGGGQPGPGGGAMPVKVAGKLKSDFTAPAKRAATQPAGGGRHGNDHHSVGQSAEFRRNEIPLDGDSRNF